MNLPCLFLNKVILDKSLIEVNGRGWLIEVSMLG